MFRVPFPALIRPAVPVSGEFTVMVPTAIIVAGALPNASVPFGVAASSVSVPDVARIWPLVTVSVEPALNDTVAVAVERRALIVCDPIGPALAARVTLPPDPNAVW